MDFLVPKSMDLGLTRLLLPDKPMMTTEARPSNWNNKVTFSKNSEKISKAVCYLSISWVSEFSVNEIEYVFQKHNQNILDKGKQTNNGFMGSSWIYHF